MFNGSNATTNVVIDVPGYYIDSPAP
jgi:hypothetical protein